MKKNHLFIAVAMFACLIFSAQMMAQEERAEEKSDTKVIIIEEKVDKYGNKTVTKTVKEGNFTDEEIEKMIEGEGGQEKEMVFFGDHGKKGYLGVQIRDTDNGVEITEVVEGSAAADASLNAGDIITAVNGTAVESMEGLVEMISDLEPGTEVEISYTRSGAAQTTTATLGERSNVFSFESMDGIEWEEQGEMMEKEMKEMHKKMEKMHEKMDKMHDKEHRLHKEHMEGANQSPRPRFGVFIDEAEGGVVVNEVVEGSLAESAGLNEGDIITSFNGVAVSTPEELIAAVKGAEAGQKIAVKYLRDGKAAKTTVTFE